jgi:hypothetical protein
MQRPLMEMCLRVLKLSRGRPFSWIEESSEENLDYFAALDLAALESPPQSDAHEVAAPLARATTKDLRR